MKTVLGVLLLSAAAYGAVDVVLAPNASPRELYGASRLRAALAEPGIRVPPRARVLARVNAARFAPGQTEAFHLGRAGADWVVEGGGPSGVLYGCLELAARARAAHGLPEAIDLTDQPAFRIRGTNLFWMKNQDKGYNWPVTPENFPWFFDRALMTRYLDQLADNRYNAIFFWNGHPFPYFLKLARYPEARMLSEAELDRNIAYLKWFTAEADRRGLWTVFHFYNIHVSPAFAKAHAAEGVKVENPAATPLLVAYTRYVIGEFVKQYPSVGLMLTAGEALRVNPEEFVRDAIVAGIRDSGKHPPLIVRQWTIDPYRYRDIIRPSYDNLYTMMKHNTEMIVSPYPDPRNRVWISFGQSHIVNVHENADVKPFRWGSPLFIRQMVSLWKQMGVAGFHLYPMTSWLWPRALDRAPLSTIDRDRIWIEAFGRYGWQPDRPAAEEEAHWKGELAARFGSAPAGAAAYSYYVLTGPVLPGLQNLVNIYNMNYHPTAVAQEATLNGILRSDRWEDVGDNLARPLDDLTLARYERRYGPLSREARQSPPLSVKEFLLPHGARIEPVRLAERFESMAEESLAALQAARPEAERDEYARLITDNRCVLLLARFYRHKIAAAIAKGRYDAAGDPAQYQAMLRDLDASVAAYRELDETASAAYRLATDLGDWYQWKTVRRSFEQEAAFYHAQFDLRARGADLVYLGLDGPLDDSTNAFHWSLEAGAREAGWSSQSYALADNPFGRARLAVIYDWNAAARYREALKPWIRAGGKLLVFDSMARACPNDLLEGIRFMADPDYRGALRVAFAESADPLLKGLAGTTVTEAAPIPASIRAASPEWTELAYTVERNAGDRQFSVGYPTFGPRWASLMNPARVPVMLVRRYGAGAIVLAQLGAPQVPVRAAPEAPPEYIVTLARNLVAWASGR